MMIMMMFAIIRTLVFRDKGRRYPTDYDYWNVQTYTCPRRQQGSNACRGSKASATTKYRKSKRVGSMGATPYPLVYHDICAMLLLLCTPRLLLGGRLVAAGRTRLSLVHFHVVVSAFLALFLLVFF